MTWLAWRQARMQVAVVAGGGLALLLFLAFTAGSLPDYSESFIQALSVQRFAVTIYGFASVLMLCLPAIIGVFWGAPLVARELEAGTHRLVFNQSVSRTRWLATKLIFTGLVAMVVVGILSHALGWWAGSLDDAVNAGQRDPGFLGRPRISPPVFETRGLAPIGYTAFAFTLGVAAGTVVRRVIPAMAITLALFVAVQLFVPSLVREHLGATATVSTITQDNLVGLMIQGDPSTGPVGPVQDVRIAVDSPGAWEIANETLDRDGKVRKELPAWFFECVPKDAPRTIANPERAAACFERARTEGYRQRVTLMPASRYWTLQALETVIFLALAGLLTAGTFWWLRHRLA
jgi:hypothetical protein